MVSIRVPTKAILGLAASVAEQLTRLGAQKKQATKS
jgi:hypothetical protein